MFDFSSSSLAANVLLFLMAAAVIGVAGSRLAALADRLADRTGLGEAITGSLFLGVTTSLAGVSASVTAALEGHAALAISNAMGGIAAQATFLAVADIAYRKANLEHAAASVANLVQAALLVVLLAIAHMGLTGPDLSIGHVDPVSILLLAAWGGGLVLVFRSRTEPMWTPRRTSETVRDVPEEGHLRLDLGKLLAKFAVAALLVIGAGALVAHTAGNIADHTGVSETLAGGLLSALATSLPELVTTIAAVRRGALTLAVSDIVGGNAFDVLFVSAADIVYLKGSIFHGQGVGHREQFLTSLTILLNVILLLGLLYRQRAGPANIGFESVLLIVVYLVGFSLLAFLP